MKILSVIVLFCCVPMLNAVYADARVDDLVRVRHVESHTRKPTLPVSIAAPLPARIVAGENLTLDVSITSAMEQGELVIAFRPDEGVALVSPLPEQHFTLPGGAFQTSIPLTVLPSQDGRYAVSVDIRHIAIDGRIRSVTRGITFRVGDQPSIAAKASATSTGAQQDNVISMPAQETVIRP